MAVMIRRLEQTLKRMEEAVRGKTEHSGSWHALSDPSDTPERALECYHLRKALDIARLPLLEKEFEDSLNEHQQSLRAVAMAREAAPEIFDADVIKQGFTAYSQSLDEAQQRMWQELLDLKIGAIYYERQEHIGDRSDKFKAELFARSRSLVVPVGADERHDLGRQSVLLDRLLKHLRDQSDPAASAIEGVMLNKENNWVITPSAQADNPIDWARMADALRHDIAHELADPGVWKRVRVRNGTGLLLERPCGPQGASVIADMLNMSMRKPQLKHIILPVFHIQGVAVSEEEFFDEIGRRYEKSQKPDQPDLRGLTSGYLLMGVEGREFLQEEFGVDVSRIQDYKQKSLGK